MNLSLKTALFGIISLIGLGANAQNSGTCGTSVTWSYDTLTYTLTISGTGVMQNYNEGSYLCPWHSIEGMQKVVIGNGITIVGNYAFYNCTSIQTVTIPSSVTTIGEGTFQGCSSLQAIAIPASVTSIGKYAFYGCSGMQNVTFAEDINLTSIEQQVFYECSSLTSVTLPNSVTSIGEKSFAKCEILKSVTLPSGLESIGSSSFVSCHSLESVNIPASVTTIEGMAFQFCTCLTAVYVNWPEPINLTALTFKNSNNANLTLYMVNGSYDAYYNAGWKDYSKSGSNTDGFGHFVKVNVDYVDNAGQTHYLGATPGGTLTISDAVQSINSSEEVSGVNINYTRTFSSTSVWQAWYMPFDAAYSEMSAKYDVAQILGVFMDAAGHTYITFQPMKQGIVKANTPYVVKPKTAGEVTLTIQNAALKQTQDATFTIQSSTQNFTFGGIYEKTVNNDKGWYAIDTNGNFQALDTDVYLKPMRFWMTITDRSDNPYAPAPTSNQVSIRVLGDTPTDIGLIESDEQQSGSMYRLSDKIVIINGKKYLR